MTIKRLLVAASAFAFTVTAAASNAEAATMKKMSHGKMMKKKM